jgi:polyribonucleotide nucleotidyltransferase
MKNGTSVEIPLGGKTLKIETGAIAHQALGAVTVQIDETMVFCAVTGTKKPREGIDFFPLQVEYREKFYAAGRFPGGYFKREARPAEKEILTMRVTDRPIRPLFPEGYFNDVQINGFVMACDGINEPDMHFVNAASTCLVLSDIPFKGPIGAVRIGRIGGEFIINPTVDQMAESSLNLVYVGTKEKTMMIEGDAEEISEADVVAAMKVAHEAIQPIIEGQLELRRKIGKADKVVEDVLIDQNLIDKGYELCGGPLSDALSIPGKLERGNVVHAIRDDLKPKMEEAFPELTDNEFFHFFDELEMQVVRRNVLDHGKRIDGRGMAELRPLDADVGVIPRIHGSAMFARGETHNVATVTLGSLKDSQSIDAITGGPTGKNFLLHYNFPPYSVGEAGRLGMTSRREIGHGNLAERSIAKVIPKDYPYSVRVVSEIMGSNGSTSMASVCGGTLALMDAGVPITKPVAGISVGLFTNETKSELIIDILGSEDHCGDMDFKVCGTRDGITGFQVDMKIDGLNWEQIEGAFSMAKDSRFEILDFMATILSEPRAELSQYAPRIHEMRIDPEKIGALIGPGGKVIRGITEETGVQIDINDDGTVLIYATDGTSMAAGVAAVEGVTAEAEVGKIYDGLVKACKDFGAFVEILPGTEGLVHISELENSRVENVEDVCKPGDRMFVKCLDVDDRGKIRLSRKAAMADMAEKED